MFLVYRYDIVQGKSWLSEKWKMCSTLSTDGDVFKLKDWISELLVNLAMVNYPYPANFLAPLPGNPIKVKFRRLNVWYIVSQSLLLLAHRHFVSR